jgi:hypothetical protein
MARRLIFLGFSAVLLVLVVFLARRGAGVRYQSFHHLPSLAMGTARDAGLALRGRVVGASAATVHWQGRTLQTRADGTFELEPFAQPTRVWASAPGLASRNRLLAADTWPAEELRFELLPAASLSLTVSVAEGPLAGATVSMGEDVVTTDAAGRAAFDAIPAERTSLEIKADGYQAAVVSPGLRAGVHTTLPVVLIRSVSISGHVLDSRDAGVAGASVRAFRIPSQKEAAHTQTDSSGAFELSGLAPRAFRVAVASAGATTVNVPVMAPVREVEVHLEPGASVQGEVVDAAGHPVRSVELTLVARTGQSTPSQRGKRTQTSDAAGRFSFADVLAGAWVLNANPPGAEPPSVQVQLANGEVKELRVKLTQTQRSVNGVVLEADTSLPLPNATVSSTALGLEVNTSPLGAFSFELLSDSNEDLWVTAEGYDIRRFTSRPGGDPVTVRLERQRWVAGRLVDAAHVPLTHFFIDGHEYFSPEGKFLAALPRDAETLSVVARGFKSRTVEGKSVERGDVVLEEAPRTLVKVIDPGGKPAVEAQLWATEDLVKTPLAQLQSSEPPLFLGTTDVDGLVSLSAFEESCVFATLYPFLPSSLEGCPTTSVPDLLLTLRANGAARGVVTVNGVPERGVVVTDGADEAWSVTDEEGKFEVGVLTPGPVEFHFARQFTSGDAATVYVRRLVVRDQGVLRFDLALGGGCAVDVEVNVKEAMTIELGISNAELTATRQSASRVDIRQVRLEVGSTVLRFDGLPPGRSWVVFAPEAADFRSQPVELHESVIARTVVTLLRP